MISCKLIFVSVIVLIHLAQNVESLRILGVFHMPSPSHYILGSALFRSLAEKGHDVTMISPYGEKSPPKNTIYRDIVIEGLAESFEKKRQQQGNSLEKMNINVIFLMPFIAMKMPEMVEQVFNDTNVKKLLNSDEHFDVVIVEQFFNDAFKVFATRFDAPLILFNTQGANAGINHLVGNPSPPSYIPDSLLSYTSDMSFFERLHNSFMYLLHQTVYHMLFFPKCDSLMKKYVANSPNIEDVLYNASIVMLNSHPSLNQPVPLVPNMIEVGGFHVTPPKKLPKDLQKFLDDSPEGVIYFSLGSNLRSADFPPAKRDAILRVFSKLKQKVLWKWEDDVMPGQPSNVKLGKWLPQQDILAHRNVKLFITHGGLLSTIETIYHGVPALAIPIFADQKMNAQLIIQGGFGLMIAYSDISEETFSAKLNEILNNPKYGETAKRRSEVFHDRPTSPMETAIYWVEYVARHKGASHLRVAALDLPWYKYHLLDVIAFVLAVTLALVYVSFKVSKKIYCKFCSRAPKKLKSN